MPRDPALVALKTKEQTAFRKKQDAWQQYDSAKKKASESYDIMDSAWQERCSAKDEMNREYEALQVANANYREVWDEFNHLRNYNKSRIATLRQEADSEHHEMQRCFEQANNEYEFGDKSMAPVYSAEGREHKARRDELNAEASALKREINDALNDAKWRAPGTDSSSYHRAKATFEQARTRHNSLQREFKTLKAERDHKKAEFDQAQAEYEHLRDEYQMRLAEVKANNERNRNKTLDRAGVRYSERKDAKIVKKKDGTTQIYHGGIGKGDGIGHGHTALDRNGNKTYDRKAFDSHGSQNYTDNKGFTMYDRRARTRTEIGGTGKENRIDVRTGKGHTTQWYKDGYRVSWDTKDGGKTEKAHWTNQNVPTGHPDRHKKPDDANR